MPELPPLFWDEVNQQIPHWQEVFANAKPGELCADEMRGICITRIKIRLRRVYARKRNAGRALYEMAHYVACLTVIESRN